ncbi:ABC transporter permease [Streptomyces avicenniae]|uniref:ABC transporter permease n=1 Tax=Streptomyces avicenniae TaxID=500153 RepID=UPI00069A6A9A|nr:ABC transporter permease [Streptomyces avicenniae]
MTATATVTDAGPALAAPPGHHGGVLTGTGALLRFALRRERVRLPVWIMALWLVNSVTLSSLTTEYPGPQERAQLGETMGGAAGLAMTGPERYLGGDLLYGAMMGQQMLGYLALAVGVLSVLTVVRHTRAEEETGRAELLRASAVGRHAHLTAALTVAAVTSLIVGALLAAGMAGSGAEGVTTGGSLLYGAACAATGIVFAGVAALAVQISPFARGASGLGLAAVGLAFALRAVGDVGADAFSWLSPIGWAQRTYVYVDDRWWPLLLSLALAAATTAGGYALSARRDVGAGLRPPRPGRPTASPGLLRPVGFALRLQRGVLVGFGAGALLFSLMYGSVLGSADDLLGENEQLRESVAALGGGDLLTAFASVVMSVLAIVASLHTVQATLRLRGEETAGRAEAVLATGLSRTRWAASHLVVALVGGTLVMALAGLGFGLSGAASADDPSLFGELALASLAYAPALWVTTGVAVALYGWFPKASAAAWAVPAYGFFVVYLGELTGLPDGLRNLSPIGHVPQVPAAEWRWLPLTLLTLVAAGLIAAGLAGLRRRDLELK